ncbi:MAG: chondroitinase-B domain-containing protein [Myxococcales bacterium]
MTRSCVPALVILAAGLAAPPVWADDVLHPGTARLDRPTLTALGVQWPVTGDDDHDAQVTLRYRVKGAQAWREALPPVRVHPEVVAGRTVESQFAGSVFDLLPATTYELELRAVDPDGAVDQTATLEATTRAVPKDPAAKRLKRVADVASLNDAVDAAAPGDVIELANGTYAGTFSWTLSGTAEKPIVLRGDSQDGVELDGGGTSGNVIEIYGSFVHVERLTVKSGNRGIRFQSAGAEGNVVRRVHLKDVKLGIGSKQDQKDFYLADNIVEGRLAWPAVYSDDGGAHANDDGIHVEGSGHVVCHNRVVGFGDSLKVEQDGARAVDFYGNEVLSGYDNGLELDGSEGNVRCLRNRFTNTYATLSFQPIFGGPAYAIRNVIVNVANEQMKFHALGGTPPLEPSGIVVLHNTFVSPKNALFNNTDATSHHFVLENNLFFGPAAPDNNKTVDWLGPIDDGLFDHNAYFPDKEFRFSVPGSGLVRYASFAAMQAGGLFEQHGVLLTGSPFAHGLMPPASYTQTMAAQDVTLAAVAGAVDQGRVFANVNDGFQGSAPDLGALEVGCPLPIYGPRPEGIDESNAPTGCTTPQPPGADAGMSPAVDGSLPPGPDAALTRVDASTSAADGATVGPGPDASSDAGTTGVTSPGCGCSASSGAWTGPGLALLAFALRRRSEDSTRRLR